MCEGIDKRERERERERFSYPMDVGLFDRMHSDVYGSEAHVSKSVLQDGGSK